MQSIELRKQLLCLCPNYRTIFILPFFLFSRSLFRPRISRIHRISSLLPPFLCVRPQFSFLTTDFTDSSDIFSAPSAPLCETTVLFLTTDFTDSTDIFSAPSVPLCETTVLYFDHGFYGFNGLAAGGQSPTIYSCNFLSVSSVQSEFVFIQNPFHPYHPCSFHTKSVSSASSGAVWA